MNLHTLGMVHKRIKIKEENQIKLSRLRGTFTLCVSIATNELNSATDSTPSDLLERSLGKDGTATDLLQASPPESPEVVIPSNDRDGCIVGLGPSPASVFEVGASVGASVRFEVGASVGASVRFEVGASVGASPTGAPTAGASQYRVCRN